MIWANASKQLTRLILLLVLPCMPCLAEQSDKGAKSPSAVTADHGGESAVIQEKEKKSKRPRLKYRNGPVCMCNDGLSEEEIHAAWIKRFSQAKDIEQ
jgi:hypothetical protein